MERLEEKIIGKRFSSRKNRVFKISYNDEICVAKVFQKRRIERARTEFKVLEICQNKEISSPIPLELLDDAIIMSYVRGDNLLDALNDAESKDRQSKYKIEIASFLDMMAKWLAEFHIATEFKLVRGDTILKNFIISDNRIYGIDFEESIHDDPLLDLGQACAFILSLNPIFTKKRFEEASFFSNKYWHYSRSDRSDELPNLISSALRNFSQYRVESDQLLSWADNIKKLKKL